MAELGLELREPGSEAVLIAIMLDTLSVLFFFYSLLNEFITFVVVQ